MTTTDPFTTADEARACAWAEYRKDYQPNPSQLSAAHKAFVAGWDAARSYLAAQEPTDAEVEAAAREIGHVMSVIIADDFRPWDWWSSDNQARHRIAARAALSAARRARGEDATR